jgi:hypothetical protein
MNNQYEVENIWINLIFSTHGRRWSTGSQHKSKCNGRYNLQVFKWFRSHELMLSYFISCPLHPSLTLPVPSSALELLSPLHTGKEEIALYYNY